MEEDRYIKISISQHHEVEVKIFNMNYLEALGCANYLEYFVRLRIPMYVEPAINRPKMSEDNEEERKEKECKQTKQ